jgi:hypothetical protein
MRRHTTAAIPFSVRLGGPHPACFGNGRRWLLEWTEQLPRVVSEEVRLFAGTWAFGFVAFSLFLA